MSEKLKTAIGRLGLILETVGSGGVNILKKGIKKTEGEQTDKPSLRQQQASEFEPPEK